ncbi:MAG: hypothetical protein KF866_04775 [Phycisphaeraceae bacterium]|nr:hypothetical protein [Phycisphaeraceae bacterium]MCW5755543.1 hypothetical protein [Phycisphaeraceae bacterium]
MRLGLMCVAAAGVIASAGAAEQPVPTDPPAQPYQPPPEAVTSLTGVSNLEEPWVLVVSDFVLLAVCTAELGEVPTDPCYWFGTKWYRFEPGAASGSAFPMGLLQDPNWTFDGVYVRNGVRFQIFNGDTDANPVGPMQDGPAYITLQVWQTLYPHLIAPGSIILPGGPGELSNYSIKLEHCSPQIKSIDLQRKANLAAHRSDRYQLSGTAKIPLRRGQTFDIVVQYEAGDITPACEFLFFAEHTFDGDPVRIEIPVTAALPTDAWGATILSTGADAEGRPNQSVRIITPADAPVGEYTFSAANRRAGMEEPTVIKTFPSAIVLLFNPWLAADAVYMADEAEREETVVRDVGFVFQLNEALQIEPVHYEFKQFEQSSLDVALQLLNGLTAEHRANAALVARHLAPLLNTQGPPRPPGAPVGVIEGRWPPDDAPNPFAGGVNPKRVTTSKRILDHYAQAGTAFKYGQCWNFAGVHTSLLRTLGIPARPVFGQEVGRKLTSPPAVPADELWYTYKPVAGGGFAPFPGQYDHHWRFHIWTEAWMKRPDRDDIEGADGWQALDATPQKPSVKSTFYGLGPAPIPAIKTSAGGEFDVPFFDLILKGPIKPFIEHNGQWVQANAQPRPAPVIITDANGVAPGFIDRLPAYKPVPAPPPDPAIVTFDITRAATLFDDIVLRATLTNPHAVARTFSFTLSWAPTTNGADGPTTYTVATVLLEPSESHELSLTIEPVKYWQFMERMPLIAVSAIAVELPHQVFHIHSTYAGVPKIQAVVSIDPPGPFVVGNSFDVTMTMTNPLPFHLTECSFDIGSPTGTAFGADESRTLPVGVILSGQTISRTLTLNTRYDSELSHVYCTFASTQLFARSNAVPIIIAPCYADWDENGIVDAVDFFAYLDLFDALDLSADLTGSTDPQSPDYGVPDGIVDPSDFFYYLDLFVAGCS